MKGTPQPLQPFRAVIFDMDGVIVDSEPRHERAFFEVLEEIGYRQAFLRNFSDYIGRSDRDLWIDFVNEHRPPQPLEELLARKRERVVNIIREEEPLFAGLTELVASLAERYALALASGSERAVVDEVLQLQGLWRFFRATVSSSDVAKGKPEPDIFLKAAALLKVEPPDCVVIEDSRPGVAAGLAAGMQVVAITNTHPAAELSPATRVVQDYDQMRQVLLRA